MKSPDPESAEGETIRWFILSDADTGFYARVVYNADDLVRHVKSDLGLDETEAEDLRGKIRPASEAEARVLDAPREYGQEPAEADLRALGVKEDGGSDRCCSGCLLPEWGGVSYSQLDPASGLCASCALVRSKLARAFDLSMWFRDRVSGERSDGLRVEQTHTYDGAGVVIGYRARSPAGVVLGDLLTETSYGAAVEADERWPLGTFKKEAK